MGNKWNPAFAHGIFSHKTYNAYKQSAMEFCSWLKIEYPEVKHIDKISKESAIQYLQARQAEGKSPYTLSKDMAALNKLFKTGITKKEAGLNNRSYKDVTRSRAERQNDKKYNPRNYEKQIMFAKATGCLRESVLGGQYQVKPCSLWQDPKGNLFVSLIEKGGRFRNANVLERYKSEMLKLVPNISTRTPYHSNAMERFRFQEMYRDSKEDYLFSRYTKKIDNHAFRALYARERYEKLVKQKLDRGEEIMKDYRGKFDSKILYMVSRDLGHNRVSVAYEHYMR